MTELQNTDDPTAVGGPETPEQTGPVGWRKPAPPAAAPQERPPTQDRARGARKPHAGDAGYRCERRNPWVSCQHVTVYEAADQGIDTRQRATGNRTFRYAVVCQGHATIGGASSMPSARELMKFPHLFCAECLALADKGPPDLGGVRKLAVKGVRCPYCRVSGGMAPKRGVYRTPRTCHACRRGYDVVAKADDTYASEKIPAPFSAAIDRAAAGFRVAHIRNVGVWVVCGPRRYQYPVPFKSEATAQAQADLLNEAEAPHRSPAAPVRELDNPAHRTEAATR